MTVPNHYLCLNTYAKGDDWFYRCRFCSSPISWGDDGLSVHDHPLIENGTYIKNNITYMDLSCGRCSRHVGSVEEPPVNYLMPVGTHRGKPFNKIPIAYLSWLVNNKILQDDTITDKIIEYLQQ